MGSSSVPVRVTPTPGAPLGRRLLASASLAAAGVGLASFFWAWDWLVLVFAGVIGVGAAAIGRRSVKAQVLGRGVAWVVLAPMLLSLAESFWHLRLPDLITAYLGATSAGALLLARPALHTPQAQAEFAPVRYRRVFLAGAVASSMGATAATLFAAEALRWGQIGLGVLLGAFAAALGGAAVGVVRMRAWGVLLSMATAVVTLGAALLSHDEVVALALALASIPGGLLVAPLLASRLAGRAVGPRRSAREGTDAGLPGTALALEDPRPPVRARVAAVADPHEEEVLDTVHLSLDQKT
jgi:hypothetical protein